MPYQTTAALGWDSTFKPAFKCYAAKKDFKKHFDLIFFKLCCLFALYCVLTRALLLLLFCGAESFTTSMFVIVCLFNSSLVSLAGNVILNVGVTSGMLPHFTKQGKNKNNVMMLSPLNPPADKKCPKCKTNYLNPQESTACEEGCNPDATPLLLRVKTEADADKLIEQIKKICED